MIAEVKGARLLRGFRGRPAADLDALEDTLVRVSHLAMHIEGHLAELDINPLMVLPSGQGVKAADALVVLRGPIALHVAECTTQKLAASRRME
jgi:acetyltransferase